MKTPEARRCQQGHYPKGKFILQIDAEGCLFPNSLPCPRGAAGYLPASLAVRCGHVTRRSGGGGGALPGGCGRWDERPLHLQLLEFTVQTVDMSSGGRSSSFHKELLRSACRGPYSAQGLLLCFEEDVGKSRGSSERRQNFLRLSTRIYSRLG